MVGSTTHKMCVTKGCPSSGLRPAVIYEWSPIFKVAKYCRQCGQLMPIFVLKDVSGPAGGKRDSEGGNEQEAKRPRDGSENLASATPRGPTNPFRGGRGDRGGRYILGGGRGGGSFGSRPARDEPLEDFANFGRTKVEEKVEDLDDEYDNGHRYVIDAATENTTENMAAYVPKNSAETPSHNVKKEEVFEDADDDQTVIKTEG